MGREDCLKIQKSQFGGGIFSLIDGKLLTPNFAFSSSLQVLYFFLLKKYIKYFCISKSKQLKRISSVRIKEAIS